MARQPESMSDGMIFLFIFFSFVINFSINNGSFTKSLNNKEGSVKIPGLIPAGNQEEPGVPERLSLRRGTGPHPGCGPTPGSGLRGPGPRARRRPFFHRAPSSDRRDTRTEPPRKETCSTVRKYPPVRSGSRLPGRSISRQGPSGTDGPGTGESKEEGMAWEMNSWERKGTGQSSPPPVNLPPEMVPFIYTQSPK